MRKFIVFLPQVIGACVSTGAWTAVVWASAHRISLLMVPMIALGVVSGVVSIVTAINKVDTIQCRDWEAAGYVCGRCSDIQRQLDAANEDRHELRLALVADRGEAAAKKSEPGETP